MTHHVFAIVLALAAPFAHAARIPEGGLRPVEVVTEIPQTMWDTLKFAFQRDSVPLWTGLIASTAALYQYDAEIYESSMAQGRRWGLASEDHTKTLIGLGDIPVFRAPSDSGSLLYYLGDGWTHFSIAGGFALTGYLGEHTRAWNTGVKLVHGIAVSTFFNQFLKRTTGRESPNKRTSSRGTWRPFPNQFKYSKNTAAFDAFPSGHVMTVTVTFTTIRMMYPEQAYWLWPVQIAWSSALMFQMMNNGVHWASDYPLGIAMGWAVARMAANMGGTKDAKTAQNEWSIYPSVDDDGTPQLNASRSF